MRRAVNVTEGPPQCREGDRKGRRRGERRQRREEGTSDRVADAQSTICLVKALILAGGWTAVCCRHAVCACTGSLLDFLWEIMELYFYVFGQILPPNILRFSVNEPNTALINIWPDWKSNE